MLFNSYEFILVFLPIAFGGYWALWRLIAVPEYRRELLLFWLVACSAVFYAVWSAKYLALLVCLMTVNYCIARWLTLRPSRAILALGIGINLAALGYFKYANFFIKQLDIVIGAHVGALDVILPLGMSFFTFQKIAYLIDTYRGDVVKHTWREFSLFVLFFPQLIAGPIVHQKEILPQLTGDRWRPSFGNLAVGASIFAVGLFKKVVLADGFALTATPVFDTATAGQVVSFGDAWIGVLSYTLQIYFDFSGYTDMAIGLARLFGIHLPINFESPYKAASIIDFWRRWHMTLSRFLREYLYFPLGGGRVGVLRRYGNLLIVMLLGGLWHGASWTFVMWGAIHGCFLMVNHFWHDLGARWPNRIPPIPHLYGATLTFVAVAVAWVFFRAPTFDVAGNLLAAMTGLHGLPKSDAGLINALPVTNGDPYGLVRLLVGYFIVFALPNTQQFFARYNPALAQSAWRPLSAVASWRLDVRSAAIVGAIFAAALFMMGGRSEFLYYQF